MREKTLKKLIILGITYERPGAHRPVAESYKQFLKRKGGTRTGDEKGRPPPAGE